MTRTEGTKCVAESAIRAAWRAGGEARRRLPERNAARHQAIAGRTPPPITRPQMPRPPGDDVVIAPVPVVAEPEADREADSECAINSRVVIDGVPRITWDINDLGVGRLDFDGSIVGDDVFLRSARRQIPLGLGLGAEALDGIHDILLLVKKSHADLGGPSQVVIQPFEDGGVMRQALDAGVPRLLVGGVDVAALADVTVGQDDLRGQGGGGENLSQQRIGIKGDGLEQLVQRLGRQQSGHRLGRGGHVLGARRNRGAEEKNQRCLTDQPLSHHKRMDGTTIRVIHRSD